jgi:hypothetical protein
LITINLTDRCLVAAGQVAPELGALFERLTFFAARLFGSGHGSRWLVGVDPGAAILFLIKSVIKSKPEWSASNLNPLSIVRAGRAALTLRKDFIG